MVKVFGVDPGYRFTGVAMYHTETHEAAGEQFANPVDAMEWVTQRIGPGDVVVLEDFLGGGHLTKEAKQTLLVLGYFRYSVYPWQGNPVVVQVPQKRLAHVSRATELIATLDENAKWPQVKDTVAALAHALAYIHGQQ